MARQKRTSDEVYNARRRIRRAARAAERKGETERARQLRLLAENTYIGRGAGANISRAVSAAIAALKKIPETREEKRAARAQRKAQRDFNERNRALISALRAASRMSASSPRAGAKKLTRAFVARDNAIFARELNLASADLPSSLDKPNLSGKSQARIFWMSTRKLWMGVKPDRRYEEIMKAMGADSLRAAFDIVMRHNRAAVEAAEAAESQVRDTLRDMGDERGDEPVSVDYPPEFMYFVKDYSAVVNRMR